MQIPPPAVTVSIADGSPAGRPDYGQSPMVAVNVSLPLAESYVGETVQLYTGAG
jgi:hypothetical protein